MAASRALGGALKELSETDNLKTSSGERTCIVEPASLKPSPEITTSQIVEAGVANKQLKAVDILLSSNTFSLGQDKQVFSTAQEVETGTWKHSGEAGTSQLPKAAVPGKSTLKKPLRVGISRASETGISGAVTLKQALRGMSISQASELASLKRRLRPPSTSQSSEASTIKQRFRAVVIPQESEPSTSKHISRAWGTPQGLEGGVSKPSPRGTITIEISEACMSKQSSVTNSSLSSVTSTSKAPEGIVESPVVGPSWSSETGSSQQNEGTSKQKEDTRDVSLTGGSSLGPQIAINCTDVVTGEISGKDNNNANVGDDIVSEGKSSVVKMSESSKSSERADCVEGASRVSSSSRASDESGCSSLSSSGNRPHMSNDSRWEAIRSVRMRDGNLGLKHFQLLKKLGCGDIGSVYLTELNGTRCYFAMKVMDNGSLASRKKMLRAQTEREILQMLDHPFLPTLYAHFETDKFSCLVMEYCPGGDLHILRQRQPGKNFAEQAARFYAAEVLLALEYLHMLGVVYRDLKPENVLVREDGHIMLSDFDLSLRCAVSPTLVKSSADLDPSKRIPVFCIQPACIQHPCIEPVCIQPSCVHPSCFVPRFISERPKKARKPKIEVGNQVSPLPELVAEPTTARSMSFVGTHEYLAPEIVKGEGHGSAVDWWTFGIFLYELLFGKTPFKGPGNHATLNNVVGQPLKFPESPTISFAARDLVRGLLVKEPQYRLAFKRGATEIKQHPFFEGLNWALIRCAAPPEIPKPFEIDLPLKAVPPGSESGKKVVDVDSKSAGNHLDFELF